MTFFSQERLAAVPGDALGRSRRRLKAGWSHPELILRRLRYGRAAFTQVPWKEVQRHVPPGSCIVEAGAADGSDTVLLAQHFPESRILACEPVSRSFTVLRQRTMPLERVEALNVALGAAAGTALPRQAAASRTLRSRNGQERVMAHRWCRSLMAAAKPSLPRRP
jgi:tRNA G46 methylase TrmB